MLPYKIFFYHYRKQFECDDSFIGFNNDTCAAIIIEMYRVLRTEELSPEEVIDSFI